MNNVSPEIPNRTLCLTCSFVAVARAVGSECGCREQEAQAKQDGQPRYFSCCRCHSGWHHKSHLFSDPTETQAEITAQSTLPATAACWMLTERSLIKQTGSSPTDYWTKRLLSGACGADWLISKPQTPAWEVEYQMKYKVWYMVRIFSKNIKKCMDIFLSALYLYIYIYSERERVVFSKMAKRKEKIIIFSHLVMCNCRMKTIENSERLSTNSYPLLTQDIEK